MVKALLLTGLLISAGVAAQSEPPELIEYLRTTPAKVSGFISLSEDHQISRDNIGFEKAPLYATGRIRKNNKLFFGFNHHEIRVSSENGVDITIAGMKVNVTSLYFNADSRDFTVTSRIIGGDLPLVGNVRVPLPILETKIKEALKKKFADKMASALNLMGDVRSQRSIADTEKIFEGIAGLFDKPGKSVIPGKKLPPITGMVTLSFKPKETQTVKIGGMLADLQKQDVIDSSVRFSSSPSGFRINELIFMSSKNIVVRPMNSPVPDFSYVTISGVAATEKEGIVIDGKNGPDELLGGLNVILGLIKSSRSPMAFADCSESTLIQDFLNAQASGTLSEVIRRHYDDLLKAGASVRLLDAVMNNPPSSDSSNVFLLHKADKP